MEKLVKKNKTLKILIFTFLFFVLFTPKTFAVEQILNVILPPSSFHDIPENYWAYTEINELHKQNVLNGYPDNNFRPEANITRAEFATLAIKALKLDDGEIMDPLVFDDFFPEDWAFNYVQNAYYFGLLTPPRATKNMQYLFNPNQPIIRAHAITIAVNALKIQPITKKKALAILEYKYQDTFSLPDWFLTSAGKAELLDLLAIDPRKKQQIIEPNRPITRAEAAVLVYNMAEESKSNCNDKIKKALSKKISATGYVIQDSYLEDTIATIPKYTTLPLIITGTINSQNTFEGVKYTALAPKNFINSHNHLLIPSGAKFEGHVKNVTKGKLFKQNAELILENDKLTLLHQPEILLEGIAKIEAKNTKLRKLFKGGKLEVDRGQFVNVQLKQDLKIDVSNGKIIQIPDL